MLKASISILAVLFIFSYSHAQDNVPDWVWKTPMTKVYPTGEDYNLPFAQDQVQFQNPNTTTRVIEKNGQTFVIPPNIRPFPHTATQSEVDAANMAGNDQVMYAAWNSYGPAFYGCGFAFTSNGGTTWTGSHQTTGSNSGDPGPWIWPTGSTWAGRLGLSYISGAGYSTNNGASWTHAQNYSGGSSFDKNLSAVDDITGSPFFGRSYTVWTYFSTNRIYISYSTNGGVAWSVGALVSPVPSGGHHHQGCDVEVGPGGTVYVIWANCTTNGQNSTEDFLGFSKSTDGGVTWTGTTDNAVDINGIRASNLFNGIRANGFPRLAVDHTGGARNGWIYVTLAEKTIAPATDVADVTLCRSTNGGTTWTHTRVNHDTPANGKYQYFPDVDVTSNGTVVCSYYDQRMTTSPVTEYWMSSSTDGGTTWTDVAVSDHTFTPSPIPGLAGGYQGDYTGITTGAGKVWPFWADNSSGIYQVCTVGMTVGGGSTGGPDYLYYKFRNKPSPTQTPNCAVPGVGTSPAALTGVTLTTGGQFDTCITGTGAAGGGITTGWNCNLGQSSWTISMWLTIPSTSSGSAYYLFGDGGSGSFRCFHNGVAGQNNLVLRGGFTDVNVTGIGPTPTVVTFVYDSAAGNIKAYKNGVLAVTSTQTLNITTGTGFKVGGYTTSTTFVGKMDEFRLYRRALSAAEVLSTYNQNLSGCGFVTGNTNNNNQIPKLFSLSQNYPNPFNPSTVINYNVPNQSLVKIVVYDIVGREVTTLVNQNQKPGSYEVTFDGSSLSSGVYLYKMQAGEYSDIKKMVLVK